MKKNIIKAFLFFAAPLTYLGLGAQGAQAKTLLENSCPASGKYETGILKGLDCTQPIGYNTTKPMTVVLFAIRNVINQFLLPITGTIFTIVIIFGGITYIASNGNQQSIDRGKKILTTGIIGLIIVVFSFTLINIFVRLLGGTIS